MQKKNLASMFVAALAVSVMLAGCGKKEEAAAPPPDTAPAATAPDPAPAPAASADGIPGECNTYVEQVQACIDKLGATSPQAATIKQNLDALRNGWAQVTDKAALAPTCKVLSDGFANSAAGMGC